MAETENLIEEAISLATKWQHRANQLQTAREKARNRKLARLYANPADKVVQKSVRSPLPEILTDKEVDHILDTAQAYRQNADPDLRSYLLFKMLLETEIKKGECLSLSPNHIQLDAPEAGGRAVS